MLTFAVLLPLAAVAAGMGTVFGQSCGVNVGSMVATTQYPLSSYGSSNPYTIQLTVPISTNCPAGSQLWAVGTAYDTSNGANLGSTNIIMNANNGYYSGNLVLNLPSATVGQQLQVQIQVYNSYNNGQYSGLVASSSPTVTVNPSNSYSPTTSYYNGYPTGCYNGYYYNGYPYSSCGYAYYYSYPYYYYYSYPYYYGYYSHYPYHHR